MVAGITYRVSEEPWVVQCPKTREQRCWVHKTVHVFNKLPKGVQPKARVMLHDMGMAETQAAAEQAFDLFGATLIAKFRPSTGCTPAPRIRSSQRSTPGGTHEDDDGRGPSTGLLDDGLQAGAGRTETMENIERGSVDRRGHQGRALRRWHQKEAA